MSGFSNDATGAGIVYSDNVDFSGNVIQSRMITADGQLMIGAGSGQAIRAGLLGSSDGSITWTVGPGTITGQVSGGSTVAKTITGNSGGALPPSAGNWNIITSNSTVKLAGSGSTLTQNFNLTNLGLGSAFPSLTSGNLNVSIGLDALKAVTSGSSNTILGADAGIALTTATNNTVVGTGALELAVSAGGNIAIGVNSLGNFVGTGTTNNISIGVNNLDGGSFAGTTNISIGVGSGQNYVGSESNNIVIGNNGTAAESNTIRIGTQGSGTGQQNKCFISGIAGVSNSNNTLVTQNSSTAQLGATTTTYPNTNAISTLLYASSANVMSALATANSAVLVTNSTGVPAWSGTMTNGQLIIGSTGATPTAATLTAGSGISITNGGGTISIAAIGGGLTWTDVTTSTQTLAAGNGYVTDRAGGVTYTLPASGTLGDEIVIVGKAGIATITPNANQQILIGSGSGTVGVTGTAVSNNAGDCINLICITAGASTVWRANSVVGTWTLN